MDGRKEGTEVGFFVLIFFVGAKVGRGGSVGEDRIGAVGFSVGADRVPSLGAAVGTFVELVGCAVGSLVGVDVGW